MPNEITIQIALYLMASGLLGGLLQALSPNSTWLPWSIPGPVRALLAVLLTAVITGFDQAATGSPLGSAMLVAFVTSAPTWGVLIWQALASFQQTKVLEARVRGYESHFDQAAKLVEREKHISDAAERGVVGKTNPPPAAGMLLWLGASLLALRFLVACTGTLEGARPTLTSVAGVKLAEPGSEQCLDLSQSEHLWNATAAATGGLGTAGTVGGILVLLQQDNEASAATYGVLIAGGLLDAAAVFAKFVADGYRQDWIALGCGKPVAG